MSLRFSNSDSTGYSPYEILFGKFPRTISDTRFDRDEKNEPDNRVMHTFVEDLKKTLNKIHHEADKNIHRSEQKYKNVYDKKSNFTQHKTNQLVLMECLNAGSLEHRYKGPYKIIKNVGDVDYQISDIDKPDKTFIVHHDRLRGFPESQNFAENVKDPVLEEDNSTKPVSEPKRQIKIPKENLEFCRRYLPSFLDGGRNVTRDSNDNYIRF
ncbi:hypothetical protein RF11_03396 [Thelohanellus kitauei]|uniref:Integrase p58-like C-terminal domain-containing protein n=1 Tax=Thelohanellus kitauei TaxID=669202 RepID=A0A0C2MCG2_THEKT|nr:hypothetical protein RF11_03396 [Thelohanellus kitauei]